MPLFSTLFSRDAKVLQTDETQSQAPDIVFFDVETPNNKNNRICSIGVVRTDGNGTVQCRESVLIQPETGFDALNIGIHHISPKDVADAPTFDVAWRTRLAELFEGAVPAGHNAAFDMVVLNKTLDHYGLDFPQINEYVDTKTSANLYFPSLPDAGLETVCSYFDVPLAEHHDALCDAEACAGVYWAMRRSLKTNALGTCRFKWSHYAESVEKPSGKCAVAMTELYGICLGVGSATAGREGSNKAFEEWMEAYAEYRCTPFFRECFALLNNVLVDDIVDGEELEQIVNITRPFVEDGHNSMSTVVAQELIGFLKGIVADGKIEVDEVASLRDWMKTRSDLASDEAFSTTLGKLEEVLEDGIVDLAEEEELLTLFQGLIDPSNTNAEPEALRFEGSKFCLSGDFEHGSKQSVADLIIAKGGEISKSVTKACSYVVVGGKGSEAYAYGSYGSKVKKAMEWQAKGVPMRIVLEEELMEALAR